MEIRTVSLKDYSGIRVGGEGDVVYVAALKELVEALLYARKETLKVHVIGEGTNTFFGTNISGILFIKMGIKGISYEEKGNTFFITAYAGEAWDDIVAFSVHKNLWGIENLSCIPGSVGAAPVQNIGAYGIELSNTLVFVSAIDMQTFDIVEISKDACSFGYRDSLFKQYPDRYVIISITLALSLAPKPVLTYKPLDTLKEKQNITTQEVRNLVEVIRKSKLPDYHIFPNVGSFFKNPKVMKREGEVLRATFPEIPLIEVEGGYKIPAAWLIEHIAEAKGIRDGDIGTWPNQPLVIVNYGNASAEDLVIFSKGIVDVIRAKTGIVMEREVNYIANTSKE